VIQLNDVQRETLKGMPGYRAVLQYDTGAVLIVSGRLDFDTWVIDTDGQLYSLRRYLAIARYRF
jgi:hypothetical protein